jgi:hypothetical protein
MKQKLLSVSSGHERVPSEGIIVIDPPLGGEIDDRRKSVL